MSTGVWFALKRSLDCKNESTGVYELRCPTPILTRKSGRCGCSRSISNLRDVVHCSKRHPPRRSSCSPRSIASSEFGNPIAHEVVFNNSTCEIKILGYGGKAGGSRNKPGSPLVGTLRPGTPGPRGQYLVHQNSPRSTATPPRRINSSGSFIDGGSEGLAKTRGSAGREFQRNVSSLSVLACNKCGEQFKKLDAIESHHLAKHAVTELREGDSSRKIVEMICQTSWSKSDAGSGKIDRVLKIHNMQRTLARFEEYREVVKIRASKLSKKHPRCLADGNELLRFYGTAATCSLEKGSSTGLCRSTKCGVCRILRHGFPPKKEWNGRIGIFTTSSSGRALETIEFDDGADSSTPRALLVCRVIAGRVHRPVENMQEVSVQSGFDSLAGKMGHFSTLEELYLLNPKAVLPCFVVVLKP
ncbi:hypothetical protein MLD38_027493 [Melastoma candidum]|uniref:Uncharacterized protein n=1 Tax=Melastoma candidum TaxID=119954 RepID=A0ACB9P2X7_9MYRT|nr:hypothetical protein MLD38_027493 [Melastoma candidum]